MNIIEFMKKKSYIFFPIVSIMFIVGLVLVYYNMLNVWIALFILSAFCMFIFISWLMQRKPKKAKVETGGKISSFDFMAMIMRVLHDRRNLHFVLVDPKFDNTELRTINAGEKGHEKEFMMTKCTAGAEDDQYAIFCRADLYALMEKGRDKELYDVFLRNWNYLKQMPSETEEQFNKRILNNMNLATPRPQKYRTEVKVIPKESEVMKVEQEIFEDEEKKVI